MVCLQNTFIENLGQCLSSIFTGQKWHKPKPNDKISFQSKADYLQCMHLVMFVWSWHRYYEDVPTRQKWSLKVKTFNHHSSNKTHFYAPWCWPWANDPDIWTWITIDILNIVHNKNEVCRSSLSTVRTQRGQTDTQTDVTETITTTTHLQVVITTETTYLIFQLGTFSV